MPWVKLDDGFPDHRKLAELGDYAPLCGWLYICGLAFANRQLTDGRIPKVHVARLTSYRRISIETGSVGTFASLGDDIDPEKLAVFLVSVGLWEDRGDSYYIHDYTDYQPTKAQVEELQRARQEGGKAGATRRWSRKPRAKGEPDRSTHRSTHGSTHRSSDGSTHGSTNSKTIGQGMAKRCPVPDPCTDPGTYGKNGAAPAARFPQPVENSGPNTEDPEPQTPSLELRARKRDTPKVRTIAAVIRREGIQVAPTPDHDEGDIADEVKTACGEYGIPYDSRSVTKAIESQRFKRRNGLKAQGSGLTVPPAVDDVADDDLPPEATGDARGS